MAKTLIIIDVQKAIDHPKWGVRGNLDAEVRISELLHHWRKNDWPIIHIQHNSVEDISPYRPGQPMHDFKEEVAPISGEVIVGKTTNNAFVGTELSSVLEDIDADELVICGVLTQHSVDCTARMAASLGYRVTVVSDATAATEVRDFTGKLHSADDVHNLVLVHLAADYAEVKTTKELMVESA